MCGRYTLRRYELVKAAFDAMPQMQFEEFTERPRFNIAPGQRALIVRVTSEGKRVVKPATWGWIPYWAKELPKNRPCNARGETVASNRMFKGALERHRCLVPADGFYEWKPEDGGKQPHFIRLKDDSIFGFAGLWEKWKPDEKSEPIETFTIITTQPNELVGKLHDRMPVIVRREDYERWLDPKVEGAQVEDVIQPFAAPQMEHWEVGREVNSVKNDAEGLVKKSERRREAGLWDSQETSNK